ncbi:MAG: hypothetical protein HZB25_02605 [Candidatus Eisenbacteria bacterium]|nr:hypothetical protein [Candidatus Eisenbacteria bacterium]
MAIRSHRHVAAPGPKHGPAHAAAPRIRFIPNDPLQPALGVEHPPAPDDAKLAPRASVIPETAAAPPAREYPLDTPGFRYWQLAEALHRGARLWSALSPRFRAWQGGREELPAVPDGGEELNAWYDRSALVFCHVHDAGAGGDVYASQSVDVACHEEAHAVLDALRPDLWDAAAFEAGAFHEAFADIGSLLVALDHPGLRALAAAQQKGDPRASSDVSRLAEQLGRAALDLYGPGASEPDCLRDAANSFVYLSPMDLPSGGPASQLTRESHSFARIFSGAFHEAVGRAAGTGVSREAGLDAASKALGRALAEAAVTAPLAPRFFHSVAREWLTALGGVEPFAGALQSTLRERRLLRAGTSSGDPGASEPGAAGCDATRLAAADLSTGHALRKVCIRHADGEITCFALAAGAGGEAEAAAFVEDLEVHGRLERAGGVRAPGSRATHRIEEQGGTRVLRRIRIHGLRDG